MRDKYAVVVPAAPHYRNAKGVEEYSYVRVRQGVERALRLGSPLILAGDGNHGRDLDLSAEYAQKIGVKVIVLARNAGMTNTRGDAKAVARVLTDEPELVSVDALIVATCWYHVPRFGVALRQEVAVLGLATQVRVRPVRVFTHMPMNGLIKGLWGEARGCLDFLVGNPQKTRGGHVGKPAHQSTSSFDGSE